MKTGSQQHTVELVYLNKLLLTVVNSKNLILFPHLPSSILKSSIVNS